MLIKIIFWSIAVFIVIALVYVVIQWIWAIFYGLTGKAKKDRIERHKRMGIE